jgi:Putative bacterial sensory transduction regulator
MRNVSIISLMLILGLSTAAQAQQTGDAISDGLAALLGRAQQGTQTAPAPAPQLGGSMVDATSPEALVGLLQQAGYRASLTEDNVGDPMIESSAAGVDFSIYFYGCTNAKNCQSLQFSSGYDLERGTSFQAMNDWNSTQRFGYAYLDNESDPFVNMDVNMAYGISTDGFFDTLAIWEQVLSDFHTHIDW